MYKCIVFDFTNTLCSNNYFESLPIEHRNLITKIIFSDEGKKRFENDWLSGSINYETIIQELSNHLPYSKTELFDLFHKDCEKFTLNQPIFNFSQKIRPYMTTAIATINHDVFSRIITSKLKLFDSFDLILNSSDIGTISKLDLLKLISEKTKTSYSDILLIDDSEINISQFTAAGGNGFLYNPKTFENWSQSFLNANNLSDLI